MENKLNLSKRLLCAASLIRNGSFLADVGTDHAYLPIHLCLEGRVRGAFASDINRGPVERARENIKKYGLEDTVSVEVSDGLRAAEAHSPDSIAILGMGGELIARILSEAAWVKRSGIQLCLQPMTHAEALRSYLLENGFAITEEEIVEEDGRIYQLLTAEYSPNAEVEPYSEAELLLGRLNVEKKTPSLKRLGEHQLSVLSKRIEGKRLSGNSVEAELSLAEDIKNAIK